MGLMRTVKYIYELRKMNRLNLATIQHIQRERFLRLLRYAKEHSKFYADLYRDISITEDLPIENIPMVDKKTIMDNFDDVVTSKDIVKDKIMEYIHENEKVDYLHKKGKPPKFKNKYTVIHSSGSTGQYWISVIDDSCVYHEVASALARIWDLTEVTLKRYRHAMVVRLRPNDGSFIFSRSVPHLLANMKIFSVREPLDVLIKKINEFKPDILGGYPSIIKVLSYEKINNRLHIQPKKIYTGCNLLTDDTQDLIIKAFNTVPLNIYPATEITGPIATECKYHSLHVFIDSLIFEVLDEKDKPVAPGQPGKVVVTNLINFTQPIIRYKLGDIVQMSIKKCPCGSSFPVVEKIRGREGDVLWIEKGKGEYEIIDPVIFNLKIPGIEKLQIIQERNDFLKVKVVAVEKSDDVIKRVERTIVSILRDKNLESTVKINVESVPEIPTVKGKHKLVISAKNKSR